MSGLLPKMDHTKTVRSKDYRGSSSFATLLIVGPVCFFLGIIFAQFPYDYPLLWTSAPVEPTFFDQLELHLKFLHHSPPLIARLLHIMIAVGFLGFFIKLFRPSESNMLFDGAAIVMYLIGVGVYVANIVQGLRAVSSGIWDTDAYTQRHEGPVTGEVILGREDSLKVLAASNTILALVLVGVLVLQGGQWYAERKELDEYDLVEKSDEQGQHLQSQGKSASSKKKQ
ncbi:ER membrane protein SH3 [Coniella lustricola]|uniref:ER membrane protein SH3 n=1 Tax=Coniella lustricola TaxID=2025994 RepID=A0A2T3AME1_9PEZI|nr:ER membrane protein SH3 [Coniella lustricola]